MPLFPLQDHKVVKHVQELEMKLVEDTEVCKSQHTENENPQVLHKKFKKDIELYVPGYACTVILKLDKLIDQKEKMLEAVLNDNNTELAEKQIASAILDEEIQKLEKQRHTKAQDRIVQEIISKLRQ